MEHRVCACGCGETFTPKKPWGKYKNESHAQKYHSRLRTLLVRKAREKLSPQALRAASAKAVNE